MYPHLATVIDDYMTVVTSHGSKSAAGPYAFLHDFVSLPTGRRILLMSSRNEEIKIRTRCCTFPTDCHKSSEGLQESPTCKSTYLSPTILGSTILKKSYEIVTLPTSRLITNLRRLTKQQRVGFERHVYHEIDHEKEQHDQTN